MHRSIPLLDHPEFTVIDCSSWREYRVESPLLVRNGVNRMRTFLGWYWIDAVIPLMAALAWPLLAGRCTAVGLAMASLWYVYCRCTQILWESVVVLPSLGVQFETHRGLPSIPMLVSRRFIPLFTLQDFIINEGLHGWDVRYYLAAIQSSPHGAISLEVAFENLLPCFPVLLEVYHGVHELLFSDRINSDEPEITGNN